MLIELPIPWLIFVDVAAWFVIHMGVAWLGIRLSTHRFNHDSWLYRPRRWEQGGRAYERVLAIRRWKRMLPDGAALFSGGFRKANLGDADDAAYLERFRRETCRAEAVHLVVFGCAALFFIWNPWPVGIVMIVYGALANLPCIAAQRYNRIRLGRVIAARQRRAQCR